MEPTTLDEKIKTLTDRKAELVKLIGLLSNQIVQDQNSARTLIASDTAAGYADASILSAKIEDAAAIRGGYIAELDLVTETLKKAMEQKDIQIDAEQTVVDLAKKDASAEPLTAQQQFDLQLETIKTKASEQTKADAAKKTKTYLIIGGIVFIVVAIGAVVYFKKK